MKDLETREDIELLVNTFYKKVQKDSTIGFFFNDVAKVDWNKHLPNMYDFWESILFGKAVYKGNPMQKHFPINDLVPLEKKHFEHWLFLWRETITKLFNGENTQLALYKANNIANLMSYKMETATKLKER